MQEPTNFLNFSNLNIYYSNFDANHYFNGNFSATKYHVINYLETEKI